MNQILVTKPVKQRKSVEIKSVIAFFGISLIIFGICLITSGSYAMYTNISERNAINNRNTTTNNTPQEQYSGIQLYLSVDEQKIKIDVIGENEISFVTYRWDEEDEQKVDINSYSDQILIDIPSGEHKLTVTAVDINNSSKTVDKITKGFTEPVIEVKKDNNQAYVKISDEVGIKSFKININGVEGSMNLDGETEKIISCPLKEGENTLKVEVYNTGDVYAEYEDVINN